MEDLADVAEPYETFFGNMVDLLPNLLLALAILLTFTCIGWILSRWLTRGFRGGRQSISRTLVQRLIFIVVFLVGFILVLPVFGYTRVAAFFFAGGGFIAVIVGFAFRQIGENILAGFMLGINRPFEIGDLVAIGEFEGTIINLNLRVTHLRTYDGRDVFIPNTEFMQKPLVNHTRDGLRRFSFDVGLDYSNDGERARTVILNTLGGIDDVLDNPAPEAAIDQLGTNAVIIRVYYWIDMFVFEPSPLVIRNDVINRTKEALQEEGFDLPAEIVELQNADPEHPFRVDTRDINS